MSGRILAFARNSGSQEFPQEVRSQEFHRKDFPSGKIYGIFKSGIKNYIYWKCKIHIVFLEERLWIIRSL